MNFKIEGYFSSRNTVPEKFRIKIVTKGQMPTTPAQELTIHSDGNGHYSYRENQLESTIPKEDDFQINPDIVKDIGNSISDDFFKLKSKTSKVDGDLVQLEISKGRKQNTVLLVNYPLAEIDDFIIYLNTKIPNEFQIRYNSIQRGT